MVNSQNPGTHLNKGWFYHDQVLPKANGQTVLEFYTRNYPHSSQATWRVRIEGGKIRLNGIRTTPETRITVGQNLVYHRPPWKEPDVPGIFKILYEDNHLLAIDKPIGLPVLPGGQHLENTLLALIRKSYPKNPTPVHRLGKGTSGIILFARTKLARRSFSLAFQDRRIIKIYRALARGTTMPNCFLVDFPIGQIPYPKIGTLYAAIPDGKPSKTKFSVLSRDKSNDRSLLQVRLYTGRPHQIRIHLAAAGFPLVGDPLYKEGGRPTDRLRTRQLPLPGDIGYHLHAHQIRFDHPELHHPVTLISKPPLILSKPEELIQLSTPKG